LHRRVLSIIHDPAIPFEGGRKLHQVLNWRDPDELAQKYIADVRECSYGLADFEIVERVEADGFPVKQDGFAYTPETYLACWRARSGFHQPDAVYIAPSTLRTLSLTDYLSGIGEIIKYGMILDRDLFGLLEKRAGKILARRRDELGTIISRCIRLKASVVSADERESGIRRILNYGHTAGHAVEILTAYRVPHGHAVAVGMIVEAAISRELGLLSPGDFERLRKLVTRYGLPARLPAGLSPARILRAISRDKKKISGSVRFTLVKKIGEGITGVSVPEDVLKKVLAR